MNKPYFVYRPLYTPVMEKGRQVFEVSMDRLKQLQATSAQAALEEAKRLGYVAPIVGQPLA